VPLISQSYAIYLVGIEFSRPAALPLPPKLKPALELKTADFRSSAPYIRQKINQKTSDVP
jgi:hypothetical protein